MRQHARRRALADHLIRGRRRDDEFMLPPQGSPRVEVDTDRVDAAVLALLYLGLHDDVRAWKGFDWAAMDRLHAKGLISSPINKAKSVSFTEDGLREARRLFEEMFVVAHDRSPGR
jgi:Domain of unknown function (DUF6429)